MSKLFIVVWNIIEPLFINSTIFIELHVCLFDHRINLAYPPQKKNQIITKAPQNSMSNLSYISHILATFPTTTHNQQTQACTNNLIKSSLNMLVHALAQHVVRGVSLQWIYKSIPTHSLSFSSPTQNTLLKLTLVTNTTSIRYVTTTNSETNTHQKPQTTK